MPADTGISHFLGKDRQLDYAIDHLLKEIAKDPKDLPKQPAIRPRPLQPVK